MKFFRKVLALLLVLANVLALGIGAFAADGWKDVPKGSWYESYVSSVVDAGLMNGVGEGTFAPTQTLNRAMFVTILNRASGNASIASNTVYSDVAKGAWYDKAVQWASAQSIVTGYTDGRFGVNDPLTREQMVTILYRFVSANQKVEAPETALDSFADKGSVSSYAVSAFRWAVSEGIISGKGAGLLDPKGTSTRAEAAAVITRFLAFAENKYEKLTRADLEKAVAELAFDYYLKGKAFQYDSLDKTDTFSRYYGGTYRLSESAMPEFGTSDNAIFSVCSDYVYKVYLAALGYRLYGSETYSDAVTTAIWVLSEREGMVLKRWAKDGYELDESETKFGVTEESFCSMKEMQEFVRNWEENLRPGDVILPTGHAMLYVGNGYVLDCAGSKYDMTFGVDQVEPNGAVKYLHKVEELLLTPNGHLGNFTNLTDMTKDYFLVARPLNALVVDDGDEDPGNDMVETDILALPAATRSRLAYPGMEIDRTVNITPYGTTYTGETLTYNVAVSNKSNDNYYATYKQYENPDYAGKDYIGLTVTEKIPAGTTLVEGSISEGGTVKSGVITWTVNIASGGVKNLTYKVKVTAGKGQNIVSTGGFVADIPSNTIVNKVGGKKLNNAAMLGLSQFAKDGDAVWREKYNVSALDPDTNFAERIYAKAMGIDLQLPTVEEFIQNVLERRTLTNGSTSIRYYGTNTGTPLMVRDKVSAQYQVYKDMIVGNMIGGRKMHFTTNDATASDFEKNYLQPGDVLVLATLGEGDKVASSTVLVMLNDGGAAVITSENSMGYVGSVASFFTSCMSKDVFYLLRPSQALADVNAKAYTGTEPVYGEEPTKASATAAPIGEKAIAAFDELQTYKGWTGQNTAFVEGVYKLAGLNLAKAMRTSSAVTLLRSLFAIGGGNASTSTYSYEPLEPMLVAEGDKHLRSMLVEELRGGPDMIDDGKIRAPKAEDLQVGDVLYLVRRKGSAYWTGVYLGSNRMIVCEYSKSVSTSYKIYDVTDEESFSKLLKEDLDGTPWECYFVMRPYQGFTDINTGWVLGQPEPTYAAIASTPLTEATKAKFAALQENENWSGQITAFAEDVYKQAGLDLNKSLSGASGATLLSNLFQSRGASVEKFKYELLDNMMITEDYLPMKAMLVEKFRGGPNMVDDGTFNEPTGADFEVGDILYLVRRGDGTYWTGVCLGDNQMIVCKYGKGDGTKYAMYDLSDARALSTLLNQAGDKKAWECYFVLRPYLGYKNINTGDYK